MVIAFVDASCCYSEFATSAEKKIMLEEKDPSLFIMNYWTQSIEFFSFRCFPPIPKRMHGQSTLNAHISNYLRQISNDASHTCNETIL